MSPSGDPADKNNFSMPPYGTQALTVGGEVGCLTLIIVLGAVIGGLWLDRLLGTKPLFTIFLVTSFSAPFFGADILDRETRSKSDIKLQMR